MLLRNVRQLGEEGIKDFHIRDGIICEISSNETGIEGRMNETILDCADALVFPGLINSHDHLDFNLFPRMRNRIYKNYTEWGSDIHEKNKVEIEKVLKVPFDIRRQWGIYKNLLNGVTTVVNHGVQSGGNNLVTIFEDSYSLHSVGFEKFWRWKLNNPFHKGKLFAVHVGEGTDELSRNEIDKLQDWNLLRNKIVGVHGVAMTEEQARKFAALVWCPDSNYFLLDKTAPVNSLKNYTNILFGTDSTLTAGWNIWSQIRIARNENALTDEELFEALNVSAAKTWGLEKKGKIANGYDGDVVVAIPPGKTLGWHGFYSLNPENIQLVVHKGEVVLFDPSFLQNGKEYLSLNQFSIVIVAGIPKFVRGDLPGLIKEITKYYPSADIPVS